MKRYKTVDEFIESQQSYKPELIELRKILNSTELEETVKWGMPVYTIGGKNVAGLGSFKSYFGVWFFQGVFLRDKHKKLVNAQEGRTKGMRQWRMASGVEIEKSLLIEYLEEAIQNSRKGKEIKPEKKALVIPEELKSAFKKDAKLETAFDAFTPGKKREFADHIAEAKRAETKQKRLERIIPMIMDSVGLNDKYK